MKFQIMLKDPDGYYESVEEEERDKLVHAYHRIDDLEEDRETYCTKLARYEAPGPALLTAEHDKFCQHVVDCGCNIGSKDAAYREQHARCVAVVERLMLRRLRGGATEHGVELALAALTGEAEP